jgi:hypothetical protein
MQMGSQAIDSHRIMNADISEIQDSNLQKSNIYNKYSPFSETIKHQSSILFDEIRENLSRTIQLGELMPGFSIWSTKLRRFIELYGFNFTKIDHLKLIHFYLSILSITDLSYVNVHTCFDMLYRIMRFVIDFFFNIIQKNKPYFLQKDTSNHTRRSDNRLANILWLGSTNSSKS